MMISLAEFDRVRSDPNAAKGSEAAALLRRGLH